MTGADILGFFLSFFVVGSVALLVYLIVDMAIITSDIKRLRKERDEL